MSAMKSHAEDGCPVPTDLLAALTAAIARRAQAAR